MHHVLIEHYGGSHGLRDAGALDAALYRPQSGFYDDIIAQAAALWESMTNNHPFIDGNKRVGFAVTDTFLRVNGYRITAAPDIIWDFIDGSLQKGCFDYARLESWLREYTQALSDKE